MTGTIYKAFFIIILLLIITASLINYSAFFNTGALTEGSAGLIYHFIMYSIVAILSWMAFNKSRTLIIFIIGISLFILGLCLEIVQIYLPYRSFNPMDLAANTVGLSFGYCLVILWHTVRKNKTVQNIRQD